MKLPSDIREDQARAACEWHERCKASDSMRYELTLQGAIALKLSCSRTAARKVAEWWGKLEQKRKAAELEQRRRDRWEGP